MGKSLKTILYVQWFSFECKGGHQRNFHMKSDLSLGDLKKQKKVDKFYKKKLSSRVRIFLIMNLPVRPELVLFVAFILLETQN